MKEEMVVAKGAVETEVREEKGEMGAVHLLLKCHVALMSKLRK